MVQGCMAVGRPILDTLMERMFMDKLKEELTGYPVKYVLIYKGTIG